MRKIFFLAFFFSLFNEVWSQPVSQQLQQAWQSFINDPQLKYASASLYVIDAGTGEVVLDKNSLTGLSPASTQKVFTAIAAFELLGKDYRYRTQLLYDNKATIENSILKGSLYIKGMGDPTLGSWRWTRTKDSSIFAKWYQDIARAGIRKIENTVWFAHSPFSTQSIPDGWIWQDIGNYYGTGANALNWKENQFDIVLRSSNETGSKVTIVSADSDYVNELQAAARGTGDNAYVYYDGLISGTIPVGEKAFTISAARPDAPAYLCNAFSWYLQSKGIHSYPMKQNDRHIQAAAVALDSSAHIVSTYYSPSLDSIIYWFLQKSINLYGEALVKTMAYEKKGLGSTPAGVAIVKDFWKQKGIDENELNISDGSGLSPQNRVTTHAQVKALQYARGQSWFPQFYQAIPLYNNMKMKSGTIKDVKGFCGYQKAANGKEYIFSFLVNNFNGSYSTVVSKMYKVLDLLK